MSRLSIITVKRDYSPMERKMNRISLALRDTGMHHQDQVLFLERVDMYPWLATAQIAVRPPSVQGDHITASGRKGWRVWGFRTMRERDDFITHRGGRMFP
jgi:hypothetical protein